MRYQAQDLEFPVIESEEGPDPDVVAARLPGSSQAVEPPEIVGFPSSGGVDSLVSRPVVTFLEDLVGPDPGFFDGPVTLVIERGGVNIYPPDRPPALFYRVGGPDGIGDEFGGVVGVFAEDQDQPFVAGIFQSLDLEPKFVIAQGLADGIFLGPAEGAVKAVVDTEVADIERGEDDDPVAVNLALQLAGGGEDLLLQILGFGSQQPGCSSTVSGSLARARLIAARTRPESSRLSRAS